MFRLLVATVMIGSCCHAIADDTASPAKTVPLNPASAEYGSAADTASPTKAVPRVVPPNYAPHFVANDTASPPNAVHYVAKIKFLEVRQKQTTTVQTELAGVVGTSLKFDLDSPSMGRRLKLQLQDMAGGRPSQYLAEFQWVEIQKDGTVKVLFAPKLVTTVGVPATIKVGDEKSDQFQVDLTITEGASAANKTKPAAQNPTNSVQSSVSVPSSLGTSLMHMVNPRIIITGEEEERLSVVQP